jgi:hypothetical protein
MTQQTWEKIGERKRIKNEMNVCKTRAKKIELQRKYTEKNREVKRSARKDQINYIDNLAYEAEEEHVRITLKNYSQLLRCCQRDRCKEIDQLEPKMVPS